NIVTNDDYAQGQSTSLRAGLAALPPAADAAVVLLCDQPLLTPALISTLVHTFASEQQATAPVAIIPRYLGQRGNPVLLARLIFGELAGLSGDEGARGVLQRHKDQVRWLDLDDPAIVTDVDTLEQYEMVRRGVERRGVEPAPHAEEPAPHAEEP